MKVKTPTPAAAKVDSIQRGRVMAKSYLLPITERSEILQWNQLHSEIRQFYLLGILFPVENVKISSEEHFCNHNMDPIRIIPLLLYDRITALPHISKRLLIPDAGGRYTIKARPPNLKQAWKCDTEYMRKKYDRWYWEMRLKRIPYTVALRTPLKDIKSDIQRRIHFHHVDAAVERNRQLRFPPHWLSTENIC